MQPNASITTPSKLQYRIYLSNSVVQIVGIVCFSVVGKSLQIISSWNDVNFGENETSYKTVAYYSEIHMYCSLKLSKYLPGS